MLINEYKSCIALSVPDTDKIGDYVQAIAMKGFLPQETSLVDREKLAFSNAFPGPVKLVINGWFAHSPENVFPISEMASDILVMGFHLDSNARDYFKSMQATVWLKANVKIGARDSSTLDFLHKIGYHNAYLSGCPTIHVRPTSLRREVGLAPILIDVPEKAVPKEYSENAIRLSVTLPRFLSIDDKMLLAQKYIDFLYARGSVVITSRIHAALPALGMGLPVIFFGDISNTRLSILVDLGLMVVPYPTSFPKTSRVRTTLLLSKFVYARYGTAWQRYTSPNVLDRNYQVSNVEVIRRKVERFLRE